MAEDPNFAFVYVRPVAVLFGYAIAFQLGWWWRDRLVRRREERVAKARNVAP